MDSSTLCLLLLAAAYLLDLLVGDPNWYPHPVILMGKVIKRLEKMLRLGATTPLALRLKGVLFPVVLVGGAFWITQQLIDWATYISPYLGWALEAWLIATTIAVKGLADAGRGIWHALQAGDLPLARQRLSWVVGRDTEHLDEREVTRGAVETVAENIVDAVTSPLFFACLGGAPLAMAYRAANTLDSMVGYKNEQYRDLGWASARFDDLMNFLPARLTLPFLILAASILKYNEWRTWIIAKRDARKHPSPNSGYAEAAVAGALGIRLGGENSYGGVVSFRAYLGDPLETLAPIHIKRTIRLLYVSTAFYTGMLLLMTQLFALDWSWNG